MNPPPICAWRVCHSRRREGCVFRSGLVTRTGGRIVSMLVRFPPGFGRYKMCFALCLAQVRTHKDCLPRLSRLGIGLTLPFSFLFTAIVFLSFALLPALVICPGKTRICTVNSKVVVCQSQVSKKLAAS